MPSIPACEFWFLTGSQSLYGSEVLRQVDKDSQVIVERLNADPAFGAKLVFKPVLTDSAGIAKLCREADADPKCAGLICWMHTFSPAKLWIEGLKGLATPFCHFHTQFNCAIPWELIDMDFMNLNQSAHGGREFGFLASRLRRERRVIVGHWEDVEVRRELGAWCRTASGYAALRSLRVVRFADNMREVAVTDGDKVEAEIRFGFSVNTHPVGELVEVIESQSDADVHALCQLYAESYTLVPELQEGAARHESLRNAAKIELGLREFLVNHGFDAFSNCFQDLTGMDQLPGLPVQRLMQDGYGFGPEGDWKSAALVRALKVIAGPNDRGTSFMEDYTYHLDPGGMRCLGAHMLEICPSLAAGRPSCEVHPLFVGGKNDPVRLVFDGKPGMATNACLVDMGNRFRFIISEVEAVEPVADLPNLPVARVLWKILPDLKTGAAAWIYAGGAHHTVFSYSVSTSQLTDFADMAGVEAVVINSDTHLRDLRNELRWNDAAYGLKSL